MLATWAVVLVFLTALLILITYETDDTEEERGTDRHALLVVGLLLLKPQSLFQMFFWFGFSFHCYCSDDGCSRNWRRGNTQ